VSGTDDDDDEVCMNGCIWLFSKHFYKASKEHFVCKCNINEKVHLEMA